MKDYKKLSKIEKEDAFLVACFEGDIKIVEYLTSGKDFPCVDIFCADTNAPEYRENVCLTYALETGSLEVVSHLLNLPQGETLFRIKGKDTFHDAYKNKQMDIVYYLIFEKDIDINVCEKYSGEKRQELDNLFSKKCLYKSLESDIKEKQIKTIKIKI